MKYEAEQQMTRVDKLSCIAARGVREAAATYMCGRELCVTRARLTHSFVSVGSHDSHIMVENVNISINHCLPGYEQLVWNLHSHQSRLRYPRGYEQHEKDSCVFAKQCIVHGRSIARPNWKNIACVCVVVCRMVYLRRDLHTIDHGDVSPHTGPCLVSNDRTRRPADWNYSSTVCIHVRVCMCAAHILYRLINATSKVALLFKNDKRIYTINMESKSGNGWQSITTGGRAAP